MRLKSVLLVLTLAAGTALGAFATSAFASLPSGERVNGQSTIEPAYDDLTGNVVYLLTPNHAKLRANPRAWAPLYVIMYPSSAAGIAGTVDCAHQPMDNCPDHGPLLAGLAKGMDPAVYGAGVWGHDHILTGHPGVGGDFNIAWMPVAVLFKPGVTITHITTLAQLQAAETAHELIEIPLPSATFHCSVVGPQQYDRGTAVTPAPPLP